MKKNNLLEKETFYFYEDEKLKGKAIYNTKEGFVALLDCVGKICGKIDESDIEIGETLQKRFDSIPEDVTTFNLWTPKTKEVCWYKGKRKYYGKVELYDHVIFLVNSQGKTIKGIEKHKIKNNENLKDIFEKIPYNITSFEFTTKIKKDFTNFKRTP